MFKCENCGVQVGVNQPMNKVVVEQKHRNYENFVKKGYERGRTVYSTGWEIIKEIGACPKCFISFTGKEPKTREPTPLKRVNPRFVDAESTRKWGNRSKQQQPREQKERKAPVVEVINPVKIEKS